MSSGSPASDFGQRVLGVDLTDPNEGHCAPVSPRAVPDKIGSAIGHGRHANLSAQEENLVPENIVRRIRVRCLLSESYRGLTPFLLQPDGSQSAYRPVLAAAPAAIPAGRDEPVHEDELRTAHRRLVFPSSPELPGPTSAMARDRWRCSALGCPPSDLQYDQPGPLREVGGQPVCPVEPDVRHAAVEPCHPDLRLLPVPTALLLAREPARQTTQLPQFLDEARAPRLACRWAAWRAECRGRSRPARVLFARGGLVLGVDLHRSPVCFAGDGGPRILPPFHGSRLDADVSCGRAP